MCEHNIYEIYARRDRTDTHGAQSVDTHDEIRIMVNRIYSRAANQHNANIACNITMLLILVYVHI